MIKSRHLWWARNALWIKNQKVRSSVSEQELLQTNHEAWIAITHRHRQRPLNEANTFKRLHSQWKDGLGREKSHPLARETSRKLLITDLSFGWKNTILTICNNEPALAPVFGLNVWVHAFQKPSCQEIKIKMFLKC